tara:strand:+ start:3369 stop:4964 length:1596 start_codon:yes stop_codon:yes gene_type:complete
MSAKILDIIGWTGILVVIVGMALRLLMPASIDLWWWTMVIGLIIVAIYGLGQWRNVVAFFKKSQTQHGALAASSILLVLAILIGVNYILARQNKRWDLTAARQYSLSDQTIQLLESLESPIRIMVFAQETTFQPFRDSLAEYEYTSDYVTLEYIDVDRNPGLARQYDVQSYGTVVFDYNERIERVVSNQEQDLTNALIKAVEGEERKAYFLQGHGERDPENTDQRIGYSNVEGALLRDNISVETLILTQAGQVPSDASILIIAGPSNDLLPTEIGLLQKYLSSGGKLLVLLDPPEEPDTTNQDNLVTFLGEWGVEIGNDIVVDASGVGQLLGTDAATPVAASYPQHPITDRFELLTAFPLARSIKTSPSDERTQIVVETSPQSWAESNLDLSGGEVSMEEDLGDVPGPISIAVSVAVEASQNIAEDVSSDVTQINDENTEDSPAETRLVVFGDSDFASNGYLGIQGNADLLLNTVNWLAEQENLISIRPRAPEDRRITLTQEQQFRITIITLLLIPGFIVGSGFFVWWRRR